MDNRPIGVMDSGVGGLTVLKEIIKSLPNESYIFIGDQANLPYGQKRPELVRQLTERIANYLVAQNVKLFVIACNTATAAALDYLRQRLPIPVIGVIQPGAESAARQSKTHRVGVIATNGTVQSGDYQRIIKQSLTDATVYSLGCPDFVTMVEHGDAGKAETQKRVTQQLAYFSDKSIDSLVLGCTHFPVLQREIQRALPKGVRLIDPGISTAQHIVDYLSQHDQLREAEAGKPVRQFFTTGEPAEFARVADQLLKRQIHADHLNLGKADV